MVQRPDSTTNQPDRIMPGVDLADRYAVGEIVGYGGMATVYRGRDTLLDRDVAIKVLNQQIGDSERDRAAFLREARAAASLSHPGIVGTYDAGVFAGWPYIVMEYVPGGSLKEVIDTRAPLPPEQALPIAVAMADALAYGHDHGLVHCDVKPQNVLIDVARHPKLVDFGISQSVAATAALTATVSGTAGYVAPEQLEGLPLDGRADVYSLGTVLYQMLSGALPFEAPNLTALATRRLVADARPLRDANPNVAPALAAVVMRTLARNREDRYSTAGELAGALRAYMQGRPPLGTTERISRQGADATQVWQRPVVSPVPVVADRALPGSSGLFWPLSLLLAALLAVLIVLLVVILPSRDGSATTAGVPQVTSTRLDQAARQLQAEGLKVVVELVPSDQPPGTVLGQQPPPGTTQSTNDPVVLRVSRGQ